jgi:hypothetical protein
MRLSHFPLMARAGQIDGTYEWAVVGLPYIVVFVIDEAHEVLIVIAVFHTARNR